MKSILSFIVTAVLLCSLPAASSAQAPNLGAAARYVLFTGVGAVTHTGVSQVTGNVGSNSGSATGFGNVNGVMHSGDSSTAKAAADLLTAYQELDGTSADFFPSALLGGDTLIEGVYYIGTAASLDGIMTLDAKGNPNAVFIFQIDGAFSTSANSKVNLINGAIACNVYWKIEGLVDMASGTTMRGTIIVNNAAITMAAGDTLEGRALSTNGAITVNGVMAYTPIGCGSPVLNGPAAPSLLTTADYGIFSANGPVSNAGVTKVTGDVGTNVGLTTGFDTLLVTGTVHPIPDSSTSHAAADLLTVYTYLNTLPADIELLYPAQFGRNLVLTPHTYILKAKTTLTDTLYLNALGNANAVFVIQINGAFSTGTYSKVILINGAQAQNVYWKIDGAVEINDYSIFSGTLVANNGAIDIKTGVVLNGRALTTKGAISVSAITVNQPTGTTVAPVITGTTGGTICGSGAVTLGATSNTGTINWYENLTGGVSVGTGTSFTTPVLTITTIYFVDATQGSATSSPRSSVTATVNSNAPVITGTTPGTICGSGSVTLKAAASYGTINWYTNITGGSPIHTGTTFTTPVISTSTPYFVDATSGSCTSSSRTSVTANVSSTLPVITGTTPRSICGPGVVRLGATASAGTVKWYANLTGGAALFTGISFTTPSLTISTTYFVDANFGTCVSASRTAVVATINSIPSITSIINDTICGPGQAILGATASAGTISWFANISGGTALGTGTSFTTPPISIATTYYASVSTGSCTSASRTAAIATINTVPTITATTGGSVDDSGPVTLGATASAGTINWYANATGGTSLQAGTSYTTPVITETDTFYVEATLAGCTSPARTAVIAIVKNTIGISTIARANQVTIYPNPFNATATISMNEGGSTVAMAPMELRIFNAFGAEVMNMPISGPVTVIETAHLPSGVYFYIITDNNNSVQTGRLVSQK
jgi:hypothetical protein